MRRGTLIASSYRIVDRLGSTVFLVEDDARRAALQILPGNFDAIHDVVGTCFTEACEAAATGHPSIAQVYDVGCTGDGTPFLVSELISIPSLATRLRRGPIPLRDAIEIARSIALALAAVHERGIVHGSLCPDRIFVEGDRIKLTGFGLHRLGGGDAMLPTAWSALELPVYTAPEQCRVSGSCDPRSDLYALGCLLYEMITGRPPFASERFCELLTSHLMAPPPELHGPGATLVGRMLAKDPDDRPTSAIEVACALAGLLRAREPAPSTSLATRLLAGIALALVTVISVAYVNPAENLQLAVHTLERASLPP